ncbi:hypothetical protein R3P38DRAFT_3108836 [Favolaschia claudopus]|uniref:Uncharacterized protein n=1 Tax=Favolaschia claudopus TaxID=2862362 RepID=A0AAV9ZHP7_9AGAR
MLSIFFLSSAGILQGLIFLFYIAQVAQALDITIPSAPVLNGASFSVGWAASLSDPLAFKLQLLCIGKLTLEAAVDRLTVTNGTGTVSYLAGCLGDHTVQAVASSGSPATPLAISDNFQVVSAVAATTITQTVSSVRTVTQPLLSGAPTVGGALNSSPSDSRSSQTNNNRTTLAVVGALLGIISLILAGLVGILFLRLRRRRQEKNGGVDASLSSYHRPQRSGTIASWVTGRPTVATVDSTNVGGQIYVQQLPHQQGSQNWHSPVETDYTDGRSLMVGGQTRPPSYHKQSMAQMWPMNV